METNPNIIKLLEMLDHPEAYSEQEIRDIINSDDETREAYRLMVMAKQGYRHGKTDGADDIEAAWQRFEGKALKEDENTGRFSRYSSFHKIAASFIGILLVSSIAFAAIHIVRRYQKSEAPQVGQASNGQASTNQTATARDSVIAFPTDSIITDTLIAQPKVFDNIPLEEMLTEIAAQYNVEIKYQNDEARQLRFHFVWNRQKGIEQVVGDLNHFERLHVTLKDNQLIVE